MTWLWRISSSLALLSCCLHAATVSGRVQLEDSREPGVIKRRDYSSVVLWLVSTGNRAAPQSSHSAPAVMDQRNKTFVPHILAVEAGTVVRFPNSDPIFHNAFSNYEGRVFDLGLYPPGTSRHVAFDRPGIVRVFCNIHSAMSAVIVVVPSPWFAVTVRDGTFSIPNVPPGEYLLRVFHERATPATLQSLERRITLADGPFDLGLLRVSESGFLQIPHKNKYGGEYGPENENNNVYPAPHK